MALRRKASRGQREHASFPGFTDVAEIGMGSLSVVFRARELGTNRLVALKLLNVRDASPRSMESFERESVALGALSSHPNIVTLYRVFRTPDDRPVLVLELCAGVVADELRTGGGMAVQRAVAIGIKIAGALETAHRAGILHRDVKPQNILITEFGEPALADFGVARLQSSAQTTAGLFDFTTLHAAPELLEGGGTSAATDVYELASSLYQLIAGQSAFRAYEGESPASVILRILRDPVRPLVALGVPMALSDLLVRAMSKEKDERPPTAAGFAAELADIEIAENWGRTQFLIRGPDPVGPSRIAAIIRMPESAPRAVPAPWPPAPSAPAQLSPADWSAFAPPPPPVPGLPAGPDDARAPEPGDAVVATTAVPVWAVRAPTPPTSAPSAPQFVSDISFDPMSLRKKVTLRAGSSSVVVDEQRLQLRTWLSRSIIVWTDIQGFRAQHDPVEGTAPATGHIVALTTRGPVDVSGTQRPLSELRNVHALLEAYRIRAERVAIAGS